MAWIEGGLVDRADEIGKNRWFELAHVHRDFSPAVDGLAGFQLLAL